MALKAATLELGQHKLNKLRMRVIFHTSTHSEKLAC